jgi:hypothetical protein
MRKLMLLRAWPCASAFTMGRLLSALALILAPAAIAAPAAAASAHTWVSTGGQDNASCGAPASPCLTFQGAYNNTAAKGEITCLNSGSYGMLIIEEPITINCEGAVSTASVIEVVVGSGDVVVLRGLDIDGAGSTFDGLCNTVNDVATSNALVSMLGAGTLRLQKMKINHVNGSGCGVQFVPNVGASGALEVTDSDITDNGTGSTAAGIYIQPIFIGSVTIENSRINGNLFGIIANGTLGGTIKGTITDSVVSGNSQNGITVSGSGSSAVFQVDRTTVGGNGNHGLAAAGSGSGMLVSNSNVFNNGGGLFAETGGALFSYGNNHVNGNNGNDGTFTGTVGQQ